MAKNTLKKINKKAVSLMIAYVLLVSIALAMAIGIFAWLKYYPNALKPKANCKDGTSLILEDYHCSGYSPGGYLDLKLKNNGYFNVSGFVLSISNSSEREPVNDNGLSIANSGFRTNEGFYRFGTQTGLKPLKPGESITLKFSVTLNQIKKIKIQPFILIKQGRETVVCENAVIKQDISGCKFS